MAIYIYDGSFEGLLTAYHEIFHSRQAPDFIETRGSFAGHLFLPVIDVQTDVKVAEFVYKGIIEKKSNEIMGQIYKVFLSEEKGFEMIVYQYLKKLGKYGINISNNILDETTQQILRICQKVGRERHRMLGLLRFQKIEAEVEMYYASMEPDFNIVGLIAPHFAERLANQYWLIHDVKRKIAAIYNRQEWIVSDFSNFQQLSLASDEKDFQKLWKTYFQHIAIQDKINPSLQRQHMPQKYWKHLTEISRESW
ncbi:hypothetical protein BHU72_08935 [Desulfuribacillus stibiiarsenatis]|uniref:DUF4130 domain-containing protein n=1 Tax=Desulfuribacillus stibiiarsenatis TaxID=1390249 RepID=A0A1E5L393_9FIRM|nr:TIGR03915 family putative DNA repair protein [Desulfuribacillus stibiiarsenatis]OEH84610.1 hypothetical protein BHU72_08935 [Desulfuribacillus stibiiarsenatis]